MPIMCNAGDMCYSSDRQHMAACECGINPTGQGYCPLFPGDDQYLTYFNALKDYLSNPNLSKCRPGNLGLGLCGSSVSTYQAMHSSKLDIEWYVARQGNTDCIKDTYTSGYWSNLN